ncbi:MAG: hypothetical protein PVF56_03240 [Desulfobacterales bacterium]
MNYNFKSNWLAVLSLLLLVIFFAGCVAAIPVIVYYYATDDGYVATADVEKNPDEIWQAVTQLTDKRVAEGRIKILKKEDSDRLIKVTDEIQTAQVKVISKKEGGSKIIVKADVASEDKKEEAKKEEELALRIMKNLCEEAKADCKLEEK